MCWMSTTSMVRTLTMEDRSFGLHQKCSVKLLNARRVYRRSKCKTDLREIPQEFLQPLDKIQTQVRQKSSQMIVRCFENILFFFV